MSTYVSEVQNIDNFVMITKDFVMITKEISCYGKKLLPVACHSVCILDILRPELETIQTMLNIDNLLMVDKIIIGSYGNLLVAMATAMSSSGAIAYFTS